MTNQTNYRMKTGKEGEIQLDGLDNAFGKETRRFLRSLDIKPGMHIADVGCGSGNISFFLSELVGPSGQITAIDQSEKQLALLQERAAERGITNIHCEQASVLDLSGFNNQFDMIYCR
jgi:ubiquinone/menaquinone biosynthesis C-methylase UbiE